MGRLSANAILLAALAVVNGDRTWSKITQFSQLVVELQPSKFESLESLFHPNPPSVIVKHYLNAHKHSDNINEKEKTQSLPIDLTHTPDSSWRWRADSSWGCSHLGAIQ